MEMDFFNKEGSNWNLFVQCHCHLLGLRGTAETIFESGAEPFQFSHHKFLDNGEYD